MSLWRRLPRQRIAALAILLVAVVLAWMATVGPLWAAWERRAEEADRMSELLSHLKAASSNAPALQRKIAELAQVKTDRSAILVAANANLAAATVQAEIKRIAEASGGQLRSVRQLPAEPENNLSRIGVRADLQVDVSQLEKILYDLQIHNPVFLVRSLSIRAPETQGAPQPASPLSVQFDVVALTGQSQ